MSSLSYHDLNKVTLNLFLKIGMVCIITSSILHILIYYSERIHQEIHSAALSLLHSFADFLLH